MVHYEARLSAERERQEKLTDHLKSMISDLESQQQQQQVDIMNLELNFGMIIFYFPGFSNCILQLF